MKYISELINDLSDLLIVRRDSLLTPFIDSKL